jgi:hypothetical protein
MRSEGSAPDFRSTYITATLGLFPRRVKGVIPTVSKRLGIFDKRPRRRWCLVITSMQTWAKRNGPSALKDYRLGTKHWGEAEATAHLVNLDRDWPGYMGAYFHHCVLDEAHMIRNEGTMSSAAIKWIGADKILLVTATSLLNSAVDFLGSLPHVLDAGPAQLCGVDEAEDIPGGQPSARRIGEEDLPDSMVASFFSTQSDYLCTMLDPKKNPNAKGPQRQQKIIADDLEEVAPIKKIPQ